MIIAYLKWKNTSRQTRMIALAFVGGVFLILFFISIWQQYFANNLIKYSPTNSVFYTYFSLPKIKRSVQLENTLQQAIFDGAQKTSPNLSNLPIEYIDRELAIVAFPLNDKLVYGVLFRTNQSARVGKIFNDNGVVFYPFNSRTFLVVESEEIKNYFIDQRAKKDSPKKIKNGFANFNFLSLYINHDFLNYNDDLLIDFTYDALADKNGEVFINVKVKNQSKIEITSGNISQSVDLIKDDQLNYDLIFGLGNPQQFIAGWETKLSELSFVSNSIWYDYFKSKTTIKLINSIFSKSNRASLILKKGDINEYNFSLLINTNQIKTVEDDVIDLLKLMLAKEFPKSKIRYLSDGSRITELIIDPDQFKFIDDGETRVIKSSDNSKSLMYTIRDNIIVLGNNKQLISEVSDGLSDNNLLIISTKLLFNSDFGNYLKHFDFIEIN